MFQHIEQEHEIVLCAELSTFLQYVIMQQSSARTAILFQRCQIKLKSINRDTEVLFELSLNKPMPAANL